VVVLYGELPVRVLVEYVIAVAPDIKSNAGKIFRGNAVDADRSPITLFTHNGPCC
jgi:hypothetical protein